jgi:hypothetical protein
MALNSKELIRWKVALLQNGDIYITGNTSQTGISTTGSFQPVSDGSDEVSFQSLTLLGNLLWGTYYGALSKIL